jgi:hypothetical protein
MAAIHILYPNTDWYNSFVKSNAAQQSYNLSFQGGTEIAQYYVMLGLMDQKGLYNIPMKTMVFRPRTSSSVTTSERRLILTLVKYSK